LKGSNTTFVYLFLNNEKNKGNEVNVEIPR